MYMHSLTSEDKEATNKIFNVWKSFNTGKKEITMAEAARKAGVTPQTAKKYTERADALWELAKHMRPARVVDVTTFGHPKMVLFPYYGGFRAQYIPEAPIHGDMMYTGMHRPELGIPTNPTAYTMLGGSSNNLLGQIDGSLDPTFEVPYMWVIDLPYTGHDEVVVQEDGKVLDRAHANPLNCKHIFMASYPVAVTTTTIVAAGTSELEAKP
jgi:hypothetical protein